MLQFKLVIKTTLSGEICAPRSLCPRGTVPRERRVRDLCPAILCPANESYKSTGDEIPGALPLDTLLHFLPASQQGARAYHTLFTLIPVLAAGRSSRRS